MITLHIPLHIFYKLSFKNFELFQKMFFTNNMENLIHVFHISNAIVYHYSPQLYT